MPSSLRPPSPAPWWTGTCSSACPRPGCRRGAPRCPSAWRPSGPGSTRRASGSAARCARPRPPSTRTPASARPRMPCSGEKSATSSTSGWSASRSIEGVPLRSRPVWLVIRPTRRPRTSASESLRRTSMPGRTVAIADPAVPRSSADARGAGSASASPPGEQVVAARTRRGEEGSGGQGSGWVAGGGAGAGIVPELRGEGRGGQVGEVSPVTSPRFRAILVDGRVQPTWPVLLTP